MSKSVLFVVSILICVSMYAPRAEARAWGASLGMSKAFDKHVDIGMRVAGECFLDRGSHVALGVEASLDRWSLSSDPGVVGVNWEASGPAWLFGITPSLRITASRADRGAPRFFMEMGAGVSFVSSDAEVISYPVVPNPIGKAVFNLDSQVAPSMHVGWGVRGDSFWGGTGMVDLKLHVLFSEPKTLSFASVSVGGAF